MANTNEKQPLQLVTFEFGSYRSLFMVKAERLNCAAYCSPKTMTIQGEKESIMQIIDDLIEYKIEFYRLFQVVPSKL